MRISFLRLIAGISAGVFILGCHKERLNPKITEIKVPLTIMGQAFLISNDGEPVKLAGMRIALYPKKEALAAFNRGMEAARRNLQHERETLKELRKYDSILNDKLAHESAFADKTDRELNRSLLDTNKEMRSSTLEELHRLNESIINSVTVECRAIANSVCDADGKFQLDFDCPEEGAFMVAAIRRDIHGKREIQQWIKRVEISDADKTVLLTPDNAFDALRELEFPIIH